MWALLLCLFFFFLLTYLRSIALKQTDRTEIVEDSGLNGFPCFEAVVGCRSPSGADDIVSSAVFRSHKTGASTLAPHKNTRLKKIILNEGDVCSGADRAWPCCEPFRRLSFFVGSGTASPVAQLLTCFRGRLFLTCHRRRVALYSTYGWTLRHSSWFCVCGDAVSGEAEGEQEERSPSPGGKRLGEEASISRSTFRLRNGVIPLLNGWWCSRCGADGGPGGSNRVVPIAIRAFDRSASECDRRRYGSVT